MGTHSNIHHILIHKRQHSSTSDVSLFRGANYRKTSDYNIDISGVWESITEDMKTSATESLCYYELK